MHVTFVPSVQRTSPYNGQNLWSQCVHYSEVLLYNYFTFPLAITLCFSPVLCTSTKRESNLSLLILIEVPEMILCVTARASSLAGDYGTFPTLYGMDKSR